MVVLHILMIWTHNQRHPYYRHCVEHKFFLRKFSRHIAPFIQSEGSSLCSCDPAAGRCPNIRSLCHRMLENMSPSAFFRRIAHCGA
jgi:hypothetical protein